MVGLTMTYSNPFDELWDGRRSQPDYDLEVLSDDDLLEYDGMDDVDGN